MYMSEYPPMVSIRDLGLASALVTAGFEIEDINRSTDGRTSSIFQVTIPLNEAVNGYYADKLHVKARKFFDNIKMLKSRIHSES